MKILFITRDLDISHSDGGVLGSIEKYKYICSLYGKENVNIFIVKKPSSKQTIINILRFRSYGFVPKEFHKLMAMMPNYDIVVFNSSIYGDYVKATKKNAIKTIVFYHNIESYFYKAKYLSEKKIYNFVYYKYITMCERKTTRYADYKILLNERDANCLKEKYRSEANFILPVTLPTPKENEVKSELNNKYALFIGSDFFSNREGLSWFIEKVLPFIKYDLHIAGNICSFLKEKYKNTPKLFLEGYVDDIAKIYNNAAFIISPIFSGAGMKTKTVEALSYGKSIFGTTEAFVGIEGDFERIGGLCNTPDDFINKINNFKLTNIYNSYSKRIFEENYSFEGNLKKLKVSLQEKSYL